MARFGIEPQGLGVTGLGLVEPAQLAQHVAQVVVGLGEVRAQADGLAAVGQGLLQLLLLQQHLAEVAVGLGQLGIDLHGLAEVGQGLRPCRPSRRRALPRLLQARAKSGLSAGRAKLVDGRLDLALGQQARPRLLAASG